MKFSDMDDIPMGINPAMCYHRGDDTSGFLCGAMASHYLELPGILPDMPLCDKHWVVYKFITKEQILDLTKKIAEEKE
jgi:hypothetical protein